GVGALIGVSAGGRLADRRPFATLYGGLALALTALLVLALTTDALVAVAAVLAFGVAGFGVNPALNLRTYQVAGDAPTLVGASTTSAFNVGNTAGPWLGGVAIDAGLGFPSVAWTGIALGVATLAALTVAAAVQRSDDRELVAV
ncbi:Cmx/CmrA family chloramphenicol efflux MFS transporter, partial [Amycolatopsis mediterranei]